MFLDEPKGVASILDKLLKGDKNHVDHIQITADHILMLPLSDALGWFNLNSEFCVHEVDVMKHGFWK